MKTLKVKVIIGLIGLGCSIQPIYSQSWVKVATKEAASIAKKALSKETVKQAEKIAEKNVVKTGSKVNPQTVTRAGAATSQHIHEATCPTCNGYGKYYYYGYLYQCPKCNGTGKVMVYH